METTKRGGPRRLLVRGAGAGAALALCLCLGSKCATATVEKGAIDVRPEVAVEARADVTLAAQVTKLEARIGHLETNTAIQIGGSESITSMILAAAVGIAVIAAVIAGGFDVGYMILHRFKPTRHMIDKLKGKACGES